MLKTRDIIITDFAYSPDEEIVENMSKQTYVVQSHSRYDF